MQSKYMKYLLRIRVNQLHTSKEFPRNYPVCGHMIDSIDSTLSKILESLVRRREPVLNKCLYFYRHALLIPGYGFYMRIGRSQWRHSMHGSTTSPAITNTNQSRR